MSRLLNLYRLLRPVCLRWSGRRAIALKNRYDEAESTAWDEAAKLFVHLSGEQSLTRDNILVTPTPTGKWEVIGFSAPSGKSFRGFINLRQRVPGGPGRSGYAPGGRTDNANIVRDALAQFNKDVAPYVCLSMAAADDLGLTPMTTYEVDGQVFIEGVEGFWDDQSKAIWLYVPRVSAAVSSIARGSLNNEGVVDAALAEYTELERRSIEEYLERYVALGLSE